MNKNRKRSYISSAFFVSILGLASIATPLHAAVLFEQGVAAEANGVESTLDDQTPPAGVESADDFVLSERVVVSSIGWWGVYDPDVPVADDFTLSIFSDNGGSPSNAPLATYNPVSVVRNNTGTSDGFGAEIFEYSMEVAVGLELDAGTYYLSVVNAVNLSTSDPIIWFWTEGIGSNSTNWFRDTSSPNPDWMTAPEELDLAFRIEGDPVDGTAVPVLPTLLLMLPFLMIFGRRHAIG